MTISSKNVPDEVYINFFSFWNRSCRDIIKDKATYNFFLKNLVPAIYRYYNAAKFCYMCEKLRLDVSRPIYEHFDELECKSEYNPVFKLLTKCNEKERLPCEISYEEIIDILTASPKLEPVYRFTILLTLLKSTTLECVYRSIINSTDSGIFKLFAKLIKDYGVITSGELTFLTEFKYKLVLGIFLKNCFIEEIIRRIDSADGILMTGNLYDNQKYLIMIYLTFIRRYKYLDIIAIMRCLDQLCFYKCNMIELSKQHFNELFVKHATMHFETLLMI